MIELLLNVLFENFFVDCVVMDIYVGCFDVQFCYCWDCIVEFLKLYYVLSQCDEFYWCDYCVVGLILLCFVELLWLWCDQLFFFVDFLMIDEIFFVVSY